MTNLWNWFWLLYSTTTRPKWNLSTTGSIGRFHRSLLQFLFCNLDLFPLGFHVSSSVPLLLPNMPSVTGNQQSSVKHDQLDWGYLHWFTNLKGQMLYKERPLSRLKFPWGKVPFLWTLKLGLHYQAGIKRKQHVHLALSSVFCSHRPRLQMISLHSVAVTITQGQLIRQLMKTRPECSGVFFLLPSTHCSTC